MSFKVLKIRNKKTGLYSTGTMHPKWTEYGKTWAGKGHVKAHLNQFVNAGRYNSYVDFYKDAEIVEVEVIQANEHIEDALVWINEKYDDRIEEMKRHIARNPNEKYYGEALVGYKGNKELANGR